MEVDSLGKRDKSERSDGANVSSQEETPAVCEVTKFGNSFRVSFLKRTIKNIIKIQLRDALKHRSLFNSQIFMTSIDSLDVFLRLSISISTIYILSMLF